MDWGHCLIHLSIVCRANRKLCLESRRLSLYLARLLLIFIQIAAERGTEAWERG